MLKVEQRGEYIRAMVYDEDYKVQQFLLMKIDEVSRDVMIRKIKKLAKKFGLESVRLPQVMI